MKRPLRGARWKSTKRGFAIYPVMAEAMEQVYRRARKTPEFKGWGDDCTLEFRYYSMFHLRWSVTFPFMGPVTVGVSNEAIPRSKDFHHIYLEGLNYDSTNGYYRVVMGS